INAKIRSTSCTAREAHSTFSLPAMLHPEGFTIDHTSSANVLFTFCDRFTLFVRQLVIPIRCVVRFFELKQGSKHAGIVQPGQPLDQFKLDGISPHDLFGPSKLWLKGPEVLLAIFNLKYLNE